MSFVDWYYPQPVTDTDEAEKDREKVEDSGPDVNKLSPDTGGGGGGQDSFQSGVASTFGQGADIDISSLVPVGAQQIHYTEFQTHPTCLLYTSPSPRDGLLSRMPSSA